MEKHVLVKRCLQMSMKWKNIDSPEKKMFWAQWLVKKVMLTVLWNMKETITMDFFKNSASYCQLLRQNSAYLLNESHNIQNINK